MQCYQFREIADSYLGSELSVENNHVLNSHLEHCGACRRELAARRELQAQLRRAFVNAPGNQLRPEFLDSLSMTLHSLSRKDNAGAPSMSSRSSTANRRTLWLALAACMVLAAGLGLVLFSKWRTQWAVNRDNLAGSSKDSNSGQLLNMVKTELAKSAVDDHRFCAIRFRLTEKPIPLEEAGQKYDAAYINLTNVVLSEISRNPDLQFVEAHSCVLEHRRFAHIVLKSQGRLVSVLVTDNGVNFESHQTAPQRIAHQQAIACSQFDGYKVSCFQTMRHAIFVVSDLPEGENLALARAFAPALDAHITSVEQTS